MRRFSGSAAPSVASSASGRIFLAVAFAALFGAAAQAKPRSGLPSTVFLGKPVGARFIGMGETGAAVNGNVESPLYNPAGLADLKQTFLAADFDVANQSDLAKDAILQASSLRGRKLTYLGFVAPAKAVYYRPLADFDDTTITVSTDPLNNFTQDSVRITQFGIGASQESEKGYHVGLNLSYLNARRGFARAVAGQPPFLEIAEGHGFALDLGFRDRTGPISYGVAIHNLPGIIYWDKYRKDQLPTLARAGVAFMPHEAVVFATDYEKRFYKGGLPRPELWHFGLELTPLSWLQARAGALSEDFDDKNKTAFTYGISLLSSKMHVVDMALKSEHLNDVRVFRYFLAVSIPVATPKTEETPSRGPRAGAQFRPR